MRVKKTKNHRHRRRGRLRGTYVSTKMNVEMTFRSGWEKSYFVWLDNNPNVVAFYSEPFRIPYVSNKRSGKLRNYIPDVLIEYVDKKILVEIKPSRKVTQAINQKKFVAAREWCKVNNAEFEVITEIELKQLGIL